MRRVKSYLPIRCLIIKELKMQKLSIICQKLKKQWSLLQQVLSNPLQAVPIKQQVIIDARNYLNALPTSYLYYSLAKDYFPGEEEKMAIEGSNLATTQLPAYFTKKGFEKIIQD